jgi:TyrR family helix-turn-helix protein
MLEPGPKDFADRLLKVIIGNSRSRIAIADRNGVFLDLAPNFTAIYGGERRDYLGHSAYELERRGVLTPSVTAMVLRRGCEVQLMLTTRLGRTVLAQGFPVHDTDGAIARVVSFSYDITDLQLLREEYEHLQQSLLNQPPSDQGGEIEIEDIRFRSAAIRNIHGLIQRVAKTQANVLFLGESGVGKTLFARLVHRLSQRRTEPLVELNCAALPAELIEAELFGYEPGAFTGARQQGKAGLIEQANGGTLFLDEVGELTLAAQAKLLKVLQDHRILRVGGNRERTVDFRLITATNQDLKARVDDGRFRLDLYYRLNVIPIIIPPLRQRRDDIPVLIDHVWARLRQRYAQDKTLDTALKNHLQAYHWPGNIRELENILERLFVSDPGPVVQTIDTVGELLPSIDMIPAIQTPSVPDDEPSESLPEVLARVERELLEDAKRRCGSTYAMARRLGISQPSVARKLKKYGL